MSITDTAPSVPASQPSVDATVACAAVDVQLAAFGKARSMVRLADFSDALDTVAAVAPTLLPAVDVARLAVLARPVSGELVTAQAVLDALLDLRQAAAALAD